MKDSSPAAPDHTLEDLQVLGAPAEAIREWKTQFDQQEENTSMTLPADCRPAVQAFFACATQWNRLVAGDRLLATGLNYAGVREALRFLRIRVTPELFRDLQLMEGAALEAMAEGR